MFKLTNVNTVSVIDIVRMIVLHPDGAALLLKHVTEANGILLQKSCFTTSFKFCYHLYTHDIDDSVSKTVLIVNTEYA